jgi:hypothetical protein
MNRRQFLRSVALLGGLGVARRALAFGDRDRLQIGQVLYAGGNPVPRQNALKRLIWELDKRTSIEVRQEPAYVRLSDATELYRYPLLYLAGDREFPLPPEEDLLRLKRHLMSGGMLIIDSAEGRAGGGFDQSVRALCGRLFPRAPLARLSEEHVLFRSFYLLRTPAGRVLAQPFLETVQHDGRAVIVYAQNDLGGAWARDSFGAWEHDVVPGGELQREQAFRLGVNLAMYALCLDYKTDQVHVPFIMRRRSWQAGTPGVLP